MPRVALAGHVENTALSALERHWTESLTTVILPTSRQIQELEQLRERLGLDHAAFADLIASSPASLHRICEHVQADLRLHNPEATSQKLLALTYIAIVLTIKLENMDVRVSYDATELETQLSDYAPETSQRLSSVERVDDIDGLVEHMLNDPEFEAYAPNLARQHQDEVDRILGWNASERVSERTHHAGSAPPAWLCDIPASLRPDAPSVCELEELRTQNCIPHKPFASLVLQSPGITRILLERQFDDFQRRRPDATLKELFDAIIQFRYFTTDIADGMTPEQARQLLNEPWRQSIVKSVVEEISTIDDLARYIVDEYEEFWEYTADPSGINSRIAEILGYQRYALPGRSAANRDSISRV